MPSLVAQGLARRFCLSPDPTDGGDWEGPAGRILLGEERDGGCGGAGTREDWRKKLALVSKESRSSPESLAPASLGSLRSQRLSPESQAWQATGPC